MTTKTAQENLRKPSEGTDCFGRAAMLMRESDDPVLIEMMHDDVHDMFRVTIRAGMGPAKIWSVGQHSELPEALGLALGSFVNEARSTG
jgi:hypothetical protein